MSILATKNGMPPVHPGEFIQEILDDLGMSQAALARVLGVSPMRISHVVREERPVTAELALQYWINLQNAYDLKVAERKLKGSLSKVKRLAA
jgi:addiction module HigA family antidote